MSLDGSSSGHQSMNKEDEDDIDGRTANFCVLLHGALKVDFNSVYFHYITSPTTSQVVNLTFVSYLLKRYRWKVYVRSVK